MSQRNYSLTLQLGALFTAVAVLVFSALGLYLCQALANQLQGRDDADLLERLQQIRHLAHETPDASAIRRDPHRFLDAVAGRPGLLLVIKDRQGVVLAANTAGQSLPDARAGIAHDAAPSAADVISGVLASGDMLRLVTAAAQTGAETVHITLGRTARERLELMQAYRLRVWIAAVVGAVLTAALGYLLVRQGLSKVRALAGQAQNVNAHNLATRLDAAAMPAELRVMADAFNAVLDRLQDSFNKLSQFADDLAHDLRTPLNNLMVQTEVVLSRPRDTEEYQRLLTSNYEEFGRLGRMVESMLFLARADHDQVALRTGPLDAAAELTALAEYFEGPASERGVAFAIAGAGVVQADSQLLRRAVSNLIANAVRYTPAGGTITLTAAPGEHGMTISVSNPGAGIAASHLPRLFDRFYRTDTSRSSQSTSAGLGLAIVKSIMSLHGGSASVSSTPQGPTCFSLYFPA